jgi:putative NADH-flavin reductase
LVSNAERIVTIEFTRTSKKNTSDSEIVKEILRGFELIVDSYEQGRQRPKDYQEQKKYYSGKKKNHTLKNQLIVLPNGGDYR